MIYDFEKKLKNEKDIPALLYFYNSIIFFKIKNLNSYSSEIYLKKNDSILKIHPNIKERGNYFFTKGYLNHFNKNDTIKEFYYKKAVQILEKNPVGLTKQ